jgi:hypothetical protein
VYSFPVRLAKLRSCGVGPVDQSSNHVSLSPNSFNQLVRRHEKWLDYHISANQPAPKIPRRSPKLRRRVLLESSMYSNLAPQPNPSQNSSKPEQISLERCHICHKGPKMKTELDSYDNCWRCKKRTCYICMRMCGIEICGGKKICSSCCVEYGEDAMAFCWDCISSFGDHVMDESPK